MDNKLKETYCKNPIDYDAIKNNNVVIIQDPEAASDINFLIPVRGRREFAEVMFKSFCDARNESLLKINYTVVEHSANPDHSKFCKKNGIDYIWIKCEENDMFNKCLAFNMGAIYSQKSKYLLFHDIDCLVQSDFFSNLEKNITNKQCKAIQCFQQRRVLYCDPTLTAKILGDVVDIDLLDLSFEGVDLPKLGGIVMLGAPGGSILVERDLFFEAGCYFDNLFTGNSPEDSMLWYQIDTIDKMYICDNPPIDIFHLYHPPTYMLPHPNRPYLEQITREFKDLPVEDRKGIIEQRAEYFKKYK